MVDEACFDGVFGSGKKRGALLTGRYPLRNGLTHQRASEKNWHGIGLPHRVHIPPQHLKEAAYAAARFRWPDKIKPGIVCKDGATGGPASPC